MCQCNEIINLFSVCFSLVHIGRKSEYPYHSYSVLGVSLLQTALVHVVLMLSIHLIIGLPFARITLTSIFIACFMSLLHPGIMSIPALTRSIQNHDPDDEFAALLSSAFSCQMSPTADILIMP